MENDAVSRFAAALRRLRECQCLSPYALAKAARVSQSELARMERGERSPTLPTLVKLADALGCSLDELAGRDYGG